MTELANTGLVHIDVWDSIDSKVTEITDLREKYNKLNDEVTEKQKVRTKYIEENHKYELLVDNYGGGGSDDTGDDKSAGYLHYKDRFLVIMENVNTVNVELYKLYKQMLTIVNTIIEDINYINNQISNNSSLLKQDTDGCYDILYNACRYIVTELSTFTTVRTNISTNLSSKLYLGRWTSYSGIVWDVTNKGELE